MSHVAEETHGSLGDKFSVDAVQEDAGEADDAADEHGGVHLRLRRLYYATTRRRSSLTQHKNRSFFTANLLA